MFWLVYRRGGHLEVVIKSDRDLLFARMRLSLDGYEGEFVEGHVLDSKTANKVPKSLLGKTLNQKQATALLQKLA